MLPKANVDEKLGYLTYKKDHQSHITITDGDVCLRKCPDRPCVTGCPANVYAWEVELKKVVVNHENCIECGACRMICPFANIQCHWPRGGFGVMYQYG
jgi:ferredoxin like protein